MQVGDLVRHQMYSEWKTPAIVLGYDKTRTMFRIFDPDDGGHIWFISLNAAKEYEVVSESR